MISRKRILTLTAALTMGVLLALVAWPYYQRESAFRDLFRPEAVPRNTAIEYFFPLNPGDAQRVIDTLRQYTSQSSQVDNAIFSDVVALLDSEGYWKVEHLPPALFLYRVEYLLNLNATLAQTQALNQLLTFGGTYSSRPDSQAIVANLYQRLINQTTTSSHLRFTAFTAAIRWLEIEGMGRTGIIQSALQNKNDPQLRRTAWLAIGIMNPLTGFSADWRNEPKPAVVEAILWATTVTNPDQIPVLKQAIQTTPWRTPILPWLLAQSDHPEALTLLQGLQLDGNPAAAIPLAESQSTDITTSVTPQVRAFLGRGQPTDYLDDPILMRWNLWRTTTPHSLSLNEFRKIVPHPAAADDSVWAATLLAERFLSHVDATQLASNYLASLDHAEKRAGLMLAGLLKQHEEQLQQQSYLTTDSAVNRAARLANLMVTTDPLTHTREVAFAERLLTETPEASQTPPIDTLLPMLAINNPTAIQHILTPPDNTSPGQHLLKHAWLIERFLPHEYSQAAPLHPWQNAVAQLQLDLIQVANALNTPASDPNQ